MAPVDENFIAVVLHYVIGSAIGHHLLETYLVEGRIDLYYCAVELVSRLAWIDTKTPPKMKRYSPT